MTTKFDIIILGGGPAGSSTALSLLQKGYSVAIVEKTDYSAIRAGETIQPQTSSLLNELKISEEVFNPHIPSNAIQSVWGEASLKENNFIYNPYGHGWHLDRLKFDKQLIQHAEEAGATLFINSQVKTIIQHASGNWIIRLLHHSQTKTINARFIIDATGRSSFLVKQLGGVRKNVDHLIGLVTTSEIRYQPIQENFVLVESEKNGWWYSADIPGNKIVFAFMTDADLYKKEDYNAQNFYKKLLQTTNFTKKRYAGSLLENIKIYAANSYIMTKTHGTNWMAIGDAAMAFDPLSSQGIYKAIKSGINAAAIIHEQFTYNINALENYSNSLHATFEKYMHLRKLYYLQEKRWSQSLFWKRRHTDINTGRQESQSDTRINIIKETAVDNT